MYLVSNIFKNRIKEQIFSIKTNIFSQLLFNRCPNLTETKLTQHTTVLQVRHSPILDVRKPVGKKGVIGLTATDGCHSSIMPGVERGMIIVTPSHDNASVARVMSDHHTGIIINTLTPAQ